MSDLVQELYNAHKPVMGAPDDTMRGHADALSSARLIIARELLFKRMTGQMTEQDFLYDLKEVLVDAIPGTR